MFKTFRLLAVLTLLLGGLRSCVAMDAPSVAFFIVPHEDDWQLFMGPESWRAVQTPGTKAVFIHTTAGDGGFGSGRNGRARPYFLAREEGARRAIRFLADIGQAGEKPRTSTLTLNDKPLRRVVYKNTVAYFLRLPDGGWDGQGFAGTGSQSLQRLHEQKLGQLTAVDGKLSINGWPDLVATLREIIRFEAGTAGAIAVNLQELDPALNPYDHSDHAHTALAVRDALTRLPCATQNYYTTYSNKSREVNLNQEDQWKHAALWGVTNSGLSDYFHLNTWEPRHNRWLGRQYPRTLPGQGLCAPIPN